MLLPRPTERHSTYQLSMMLKHHFPDDYTPAYHLQLAERLRDSVEEGPKKVWLSRWVHAYRIAEQEEDRWR